MYIYSAYPLAEGQGNENRGMFRWGQVQPFIYLLSLSPYTFQYPSKDMVTPRLRSTDVNTHSLQAPSYAPIQHIIHTDAILAKTAESCNTPTPYPKSFNTNLRLPSLLAKVNFLILPTLIKQKTPPPATP